jgi:hypothetical protein
MIYPSRNGDILILLFRRGAFPGNILLPGIPPFNPPGSFSAAF